MMARGPFANPRLNGGDRREPIPAPGPGGGNGRRARIVLAMFVALAGLWLLALSRVHVNASWSDAAWGYAVIPLFGRAPRTGDRILFEPPASLGSPVPYAKTVRGLPGATVSVDADRVVRVDGIPMGRAKTRARDGRPLKPVRAGRIPPGRYYLHASHPDSHDSRYAEIGLVPRSRILGRAVALPDLPWIGIEGPLVGPEDAAPAATRPHPVEAPPPPKAGDAPPVPAAGDGP